MDKYPASVNVSLNNGTIEIKGSENFVREQLEIFKDTIINKFSQPSIGSNQKEKRKVPIILHDSDKINDATKAYENVFSVDNGEISLILSEAPGSSKKEKTENLALIYLFAWSLIGIKEIDTKKIREICNEYGCLDSSNFAKHIKGKKSLINVIGDGNNTIAKITKPGINEAKTLIGSLGL